MGTQIKVTYVAVLTDGCKPIVSADTLESLKLGLDEYYGVVIGVAKCISWNPFNSKYPDDYEGYYEYEWINEAHNNIEVETDTVKVYCIDFYPETKIDKP
jgi:hypothetical protein